MMFRRKLLALFALTVFLSVAAIAGLVLAVTRRAFAKSEEERTSALVAQFQREFNRQGEEIGRRVRVPAQSLKDLPVPGARSQRNRGRRRAQSLAELQCLCGGARLAIYPMAGG